MHDKVQTQERSKNKDNSNTAEDDDLENVQVHSDAQGTGSQGRAFSSPQEAEELEPQADDSDSASGDEGRHIDLEA